MIHVVEYEQNSNASDELDDNLDYRTHALFGQILAGDFSIGKLLCHGGELVLKSFAFFLAITPDIDRESSIVLAFSEIARGHCGFPLPTDSSEKHDLSARFLQTSELDLPANTNVNKWRSIPTRSEEHTSEL